MDEVGKQGIFLSVSHHSKIYNHISSEETCNEKTPTVDISFSDYLYSRSESAGSTLPDILDMVITKKADVTSVSPGDMMFYKIDISNIGLWAAHDI